MLYNCNERQEGASRATQTFFVLLLPRLLTVCVNSVNFHLNKTQRGTSCMRLFNINLCHSFCISNITHKKEQESKLSDT